jgi:hypothetical protein
MKFTKIITTILVSVFFVNCSMLPTMSPFLTERATLAEVPLDSSGVIAFKYNTKTLVKISMDVKNLKTEQLYRLKITPNLMRNSSFGSYNSETEQRFLGNNVVSESVSLFALPEGEYLPVYNYYWVNKDNHRGYSSVGDSFKVEQGKVTSFGNVNIDFEGGLFTTVKIDIKSTEGDINSLIREVDDTRVSKMPIIQQRLRSVLE